MSGAVQDLELTVLSISNLSTEESASANESGGATHSADSYVKGDDSLRKESDLSGNSLESHETICGEEKTRSRLELGFLVALVVVVWGLLLLPVILYHLPSAEEGSSSECIPYSTDSASEQVCQDGILTLYGACRPNFTSLNATDVYISPRGQTQEELEEILTIGLRVVRPSLQCEEVVVPFLCLYYLRPCDGGGEVTYRPSVEDCVAVSTEICPREWAEADELLSRFGESLPSCEELIEKDNVFQCNFTAHVQNAGLGSSRSGPLGDDEMNEPTDSDTSGLGSGSTSMHLTNDSESKTCTVYTGSVCHAQLLSLQNCIPGREGSQVVYISSDVDQTATESQVMQIQGFYPFLSPSTECLDVVDPFLCLYYFGLCDISGNLFEPSTETCVAISTDICQREWSTAANFITLPTCDIFGEQLIACGGTGLADGSSDTPTYSSCPWQCRDGFYCASGLCLPRCDKWEVSPKYIVIATDVLTVMSVLIGLLAGITVVVISCIRWRRMFVFPTSLIVYQTISELVLGVTVLINYTDRAELFCTSIDLQESVNNPTAFCIISGIVLYYVMLQLALWWLLHVMILFWKVEFPFHARSFENAGRFKYIHIIWATAGVLLPLIPVITVLANGGFTMTRLPPILCAGREADPTFYSHLLPIMVMLQIGITLTVILFWTIHKKEGLFRINHQKGLMKIGAAERKILIILCYYMLVGIISLATFTQTVRRTDTTAKEHGKYFLCESKGIDPDSPEDCELPNTLGISILLTCTYVLLGLFPAVNLTYAVNIRELKQWLYRKARHMRKWIGGASLDGNRSVDPQLSRIGTTTSSI